MTGQNTGEIVKSSKPRTYAAVIEDLAHDRSQISIARSRGVAPRTVKAIAKVEASRIAQRKKSLAGMFENLCEKSLRRASRQVKNATYAQAMVGAGIAAQRMMELRGEGRSDVGLTINVLNMTAPSA